MGARKRRSWGPPPFFPAMGRPCLLWAGRPQSLPQAQRDRCGGSSNGLRHADRSAAGCEPQGGVQARHEHGAGGQPGPAACVRDEGECRRPGSWGLLGVQAWLIAAGRCPGLQAGRWAPVQTAEYTGSGGGAAVARRPAHVMGCSPNSRALAGWRRASRRPGQSGTAEVGAGGPWWPRRQQPAGGRGGGATAGRELAARPLRLLQVQLEAVGTQYANALVEVAQTHNALEAVHTDIDSLATVLKDSQVRGAAGAGTRDVRQGRARSRQAPGQRSGSQLGRTRGAAQRLAAGQDSRCSGAGTAGRGTQRSPAAPAAARFLWPLSAM